MSFIEVKQISKTFRVAKKKSGLKEAFKSFVKREYLDIKAVDDISFTVEDGNLCNNIIIITSVLRLGEPCEQF